MITLAQIKAARVLLGWNQVDVAKAAGLSLPAVSNMERGAVTPREKTLLAVRKALEDAGIEFIDGGVRQQSEVLRTTLLDGVNAISDLFEDFYLTLRKHGGDLLVRGVSEQKFIRHIRPQMGLFLKRLVRMKRRRARFLVCEGDRQFVGAHEVALYRWVRAESFGLVPAYLYHDKYAVLLWGPPLRVIIIQNPSLAETYRRQFESDWKRAQMPPLDIPYYWPP